MSVSINLLALIFHDYWATLSNATPAKDPAHATKLDKDEKTGRSSSYPQTGWGHRYQ
jgi:hypothetical protein